MPKESYDQGRILKYLRTRGGYWVKYHASQYTPEGVPDILGCYKNFFVAFECKNRNIKNAYKALADAQITNAQDILSNGGLAFTVQTVADVTKILANLDDIIAREG